MAINQNLLSTSGLEIVYSESEVAIEEIQDELMFAHSNGANIFKIIERLEQYKKALRNSEKEILRIFKTNSEKSLQNKFNKYYNNSGLSNFTGSSLNAKIVEIFNRHLQKDKKAFYDKIKKIEDAVNAEVIKNIQTNPMSKKAIQDYALSLFNKEFINSEAVRTGSRAVRSVRGFYVDNKNETFAILSNQISEVERKIIDKFNINNFNINNTVSSNSLTNSLDLWQLINDGKKPMTETEAKEYEKDHPGFIDNVNNQILDFIISNLNEEQKVFGKQIVNEMLKQDPTMFFVGKNTNNITGIFGELSAKMAIMALIPDAQLSWVANEKIDNKKLSVDFYLKENYGIQIKNTTVDKEVGKRIGINFVDKSVTSVLREMQNKYDINFTGLENLIVSDVFNVPYKKVGRIYKEVGYNTTLKDPKNRRRFEDFIVIKHRLQSLLTICNNILTSFAPDFLFMSGGSEFENQLANIEQNLDLAKTGNNLYIIAGVPFFASHILDDIIDNLSTMEKESQRIFSTKATIEQMYLEPTKSKKKVDTNIVAYKNKVQASGDEEGTRTEFYKKGVKFTSSMKFKF